MKQTHLMTRGPQGPRPTALRRAVVLGAVLTLGLLSAVPALAQSVVPNQNERPSQRNEPFNTSALPSGRIQRVDWQNQEIQIDGKRYTFDGDSLRVFYLEKEIALFDLQPNALIRYQLSRGNGSDVILRIWAEEASSLDPT